MGKGMVCKSERGSEEERLVGSWRFVSVSCFEDEQNSKDYTP